MKCKWSLRSHTPRPENSGGMFARKAAEHELAKVRAQTPYFESLGRDLRNLRERNHFAENIRATMRGT